MQLSLSILTQPAPELRPWEGLDEEQRSVVIELMARLIAKAAIANPDAEQSHE